MISAVEESLSSKEDPSGLRKSYWHDCLFAPHTIESVERAHEKVSKKRYTYQIHFRLEACARGGFDSRRRRFLVNLIKSFSSHQNLASSVWLIKTAIANASDVLELLTVAISQEKFADYLAVVEVTRNRASAGKTKFPDR